MIMAKNRQAPEPKKTVDKIDTVDSKTSKNAIVPAKKTDEEKAELAKKKRLMLTEQVLEYISQGLSQTDALSFVGVAYSTWNGWMRADPELVADIKRAEISLKVKHLQNIQRHAENDVRASQWLLARKFPAEFGEKQTIDMNTKSDDSKVIINVIQQVQKEKHGQTIEIKHELPNENDNGTDEED
jgi:GH24 family phage-related lysozyme (muramidase)